MTAKDMLFSQALGRTLGRTLSSLFGVDEESRIRQRVEKEFLQKARNISAEAARNASQAASEQERQNIRNEAEKRFRDYLARVADDYARIISDENDGADDGGDGAQRVSDYGSDAGYAGDTDGEADDEDSGENVVVRREEFDDYKGSADYALKRDSSENTVVKAEDFGPENMARLRSYYESRAREVAARLLEDDPKDWVMNQESERVPVEYQQIVHFDSGSGETDDLFRMMDEEGGEQAVVDYMSQWDYGDSPSQDETSAGYGDSEWWGRPDADGNYYKLSWNRGLDYIDLEYVITDWADEARRKQED